MKGVNQAIIIGHVGQDPTTRYTAAGAAMTSLTVATTESWKDKSSGEKQERTEWHRIVAFGRLAEIIGEYVKKGSLVYISGSLTTRKWQDKETGADRYSTEIMANQMQMLGGKSSDRSEAPAKSQPAKSQPAQEQDDGFPGFGEEDIPF